MTSTIPTPAEAEALETLRCALAVFLDCDVTMKLGTNSQGCLTASLTDEDGDLELTIEPIPNDKTGGWWGYNEAENDDIYPMVGNMVGNTMMDIVEGLTDEFYDRAFIGIDAA